MKLNISYPSTGAQKAIEIEDEKKLRALYDKRISHEVTGEHLGDEFKGYIFRISGGNDKQGFPMKQGVLTTGRVRLLLREGHSCYRTRRNGERKRKSVRGCIVSSDLSVLNLVVVKKGDNDIPGLTDPESQKPRRLGPKRASKIRKLFALNKADDVRKYVIRRQITKDGKKPYTKAARIQRLITPQRIQRKRKESSVKRERYEKTRNEAEEFESLLKRRNEETKKKRIAKLQKKREATKKKAPAGKKPASPAKAASPKKASPKKAAPAKKAAAANKKASPKKAAPAKKAAAATKKASPKKAAPAKKSPKKTTAPAKKTSPKKAAPKKVAAPAKKTSPKKAAPAAKKPATKKTGASKPAAKSGAAKKTAASGKKSQ